jgi:nucleoside phosphorylase
VAKDIIEHYKMKKVMEVTKFQIFKGENELLVISGIKAVVAATYLLTSFEYNGSDIFINVGICCAVKERACMAEIFLFNKLIDGFSNKTFYPDMLFKYPFREGTVLTISQLSHKNI